MANGNGKTNKANAGEKRKSAAAEAFGRLSKREQTMIFALIALGVVCALYFFVVQPGLDRLSALDAEAVTAEQTQDEYRSAIAAGPAAAEQAATATAAYDAARAQIFSPMSIETLDATTTGYLESAGFDPETLSMSQLQEEDMTPFSPEPLSESPVPEGSADGAATEGTEADGASADPSGDGADSAPGGSLYSYSASISAAGGWDNLYKLLGILADINGVELTQYSYSEGGGADSDKGGSFSMTIKFYVFIENAAAEIDEAAAESGETPAEAGEAPVE
ncbi:MAG: type II secretion system protein M [Clostridiales Family XIII bacterium]|jgi:hypothetical protein|nr:type II secretion system protein M [Clostridiales Family XIII bacterium]